MDLDAVATELYGLAPADFTNARDARASEAKRGGDRELARAIGKFRRPIVSAWLANVLVRERGDQVQSMLDLGAALRQAQAQLAKDELRKLQRERRRAIAALLDNAAGLARERGEGISSAVARDLKATLEAASLDPVLPPADQALRLATAEALREAEAHLAEARREADDGTRHVEEKTRDRDVWRRKVADLDQQLGSAQKEAQKAEHRLADAEEALALAERRLRAAQVSLAKKNSGSKG
jgi:hypothetical protein